MKKLLGLLLFLPLFTSAQYFGMDSVSINGSYKALVWKPSNLTLRCPVVIWMAGNGETGTAVSTLYNNGPARLIKNGQTPLDSIYIIMVLPTSATSLDQPNNMYQVMDYITSHYTTDTTNWTLAGLSQGAVNAFDNPTWPLSLYGFGDPTNYRMTRVKQVIPVSMCSPRANAQYNFMATRKVWFWHGTSDATCAVGFTNNAYDSVRAYGTSAKKTLLTGGGHDNGVWDSAASFRGVDSSTNVWKWARAATFAGGGNMNPISVPGANQSIWLPTNSVTVNGSGSSDPDGSISAYLWSKVSGPSGGTITSSTSASTTITALQGGVYTYSLRVTDNLGATNTATMTISVGGGRYPISNTSGGLTLTQTMGAITFLPGDTIDISGAAVFNYTQGQNLNGSAGHNIVVLGHGAYNTNGSFQQPYWWNVSYVKIVNLDYNNWYGQHRLSYAVHDLTFDSCDAKWNGSSNRNNGQEFLIADDPFAASSMVFDGTRAKTFYNIKWRYARWEGYRDGSFMRFGTTWGGSDNNRSICTDVELAYDTISDFRNTGQSGGAGPDGNGLVGIYGTIFNYNFHHITVERLAGSASFQRAHIVAFQVYGNGYVHHNRMDSSYAQMNRLVPKYWTGLPGYANFGVYIWDNIYHNAYSYSFTEVGQNNTGGRTSTYGIYPANDTVVHNTIFSTLANTYNAGGGVYRYHGVIVDDVNQTPNINFVADNTIVNPERDYSYNPAGFLKYWHSIVSSANANLTSIGNWNAQSPTGVFIDTAQFIPYPSGPLIDSGHTYSFRTTDFYDRAFINTPDDGAVEYIAAGAPPLCTTNISPAPNVTINSANQVTLTWAAADNTTAYQGKLFVEGGSDPVTPTFITVNSSIIMRDLGPGLVYRFYIIPINLSGTATGCATNYTKFTTLGQYTQGTFYRP